MPTFDVKTVSAQQVWQSPDGQRTLYEVIFNYQGQQLKAKSWSQAIATVGWSGTVETYEKADNRGQVETFVKQPQKAGYSGGGYKGGGKDSDPFTMYLSYAKDLAVSLIGQGVLPTKPTFDKEYVAALASVEAGGAQLFAGRKEAQSGQMSLNTEAVSNSTVADSDGDISVEDLGNLFEGEPVNPGETPWPS